MFPFNILQGTCLCGWGWGLKSSFLLCGLILQGKDKIEYDVYRAQNPYIVDHMSKGPVLANLSGSLCLAK